jgi:hypothetical protein
MIVIANFFEIFSKKMCTQISSFMKIPAAKAELFHADRRMDRHGEPNIRFSQFSESAKIKWNPITIWRWQ